MITKSLENRRHYFDWAASALYDGQSNKNDLFGNPSSLHHEGRYAKQILENARERCAAALKVPAKTIFFTSGGTESNSIALFSSLKRVGSNTVISSSAEHTSVRTAMETIEKMGKPTGGITVDSHGKVTPQYLEKALVKYEKTRFVSIMSVNNELGSVTDITALNNALRKFTNNSPPVHFHCDIVQAIGKIPVDIKGWGIDSASISAHKIGGPRGIGLLYLKKNQNDTGGDIFYKGGGQENGVRGGTENVSGAAALADCLEKYAADENVSKNYTLAAKRWDKLIQALNSIARCTIIPKERSFDNNHEFSPYILQAAFRDIPGEVMARALDDLGFAVSTGSACSSESPERPVLIAAGIEEKLRLEGIRISQGYTTTEDDIDLLTCAILEVLKFL